MKSRKIEKFSLETISGIVAKFDLGSARDRLARFVGAFVNVSGRVQKVVKREGQCKLVIEPGDVPGFVVFVDCLADAEKIQGRKIRKGSAVVVRGKFVSAGWCAVCLSDGRLADAFLK